MTAMSLDHLADRINAVSRLTGTFTHREIPAVTFVEECDFTGVDLGRLVTEQILDMQQYNLFPNTTIVAFPDLLQVVKSRPGATPDDCVMDVLVFERRAPGTPSRACPPSSAATWFFSATRHSRSGVGPIPAKKSRSRSARTKASPRPTIKAVGA